ncbi:MAG: cytidine deaminase [Saprospiraceae bacterium]|nr:cytidine deaminase [Saprospiraceae bacterium]
MSLRQYTFAYQVHEDKNGFSPSDQSLIESAANACSMAYAPYSNFKVGTAIRTTDHQVIIGSNQENGAFPIGQCAERVALYNMIHHLGRLPIDTIAIAVDNPNQHLPASPCGSCRQVLSEYRSFQDTPIRLLLTLAGGGVVYEINDIMDILPFAFDGAFLGQ